MLNERAREVAEFAVAPTVEDEADRACQRSDLFERGQAPMSAWARYPEIEVAAVVAIR